MVDIDATSKLESMAFDLISRTVCFLTPVDVDVTLMARDLTLKIRNDYTFHNQGGKRELRNGRRLLKITKICAKITKICVRYGRR